MTRTASLLVADYLHWGYATEHLQPVMAQQEPTKDSNPPEAPSNPLLSTFRFPRNSIQVTCNFQLDLAGFEHGTTPHLTANVCHESQRFEGAGRIQGLGWTELTASPFVSSSGCDILDEFAESEAPRTSQDSVSPTETQLAALQLAQQPSACFYDHQNLAYFDALLKFGFCFPHDSSWQPPSSFAHPHCQAMALATSPQLISPQPTPLAQPEVPVSFHRDEEARIALDSESALSLPTMANPPRTAPWAFPKRLSSVARFADEADLPLTMPSPRRLVAAPHSGSATAAAEPRSLPYSYSFKPLSGLPVSAMSELSVAGRPLEAHRRVSSLDVLIKHSHYKPYANNSVDASAALKKAPKPSNLGHTKAASQSFLPSSSRSSSPQPSSRDVVIGRNGKELSTSEGTLWDLKDPPDGKPCLRPHIAQMLSFFQVRWADHRMPMSP